MDETADAVLSRLPRRRIAIARDGSVTGDEAPDQLGAALRYACRMASQVQPLLDIGPLQWLTTLGGTSVTARVGGAEGDLTVMADIEERDIRDPIAVPEAAGGAATAVRHALQRVRDDLCADWCAVMTWDQRVVGAMLPEEPRGGFVDVRAVLPDVGLRLLAVLASLDETYRDTAIVLEYRGGSLLLVAVHGDVLFAFADKFDTAFAVPVIDEIRSRLAAHDLDLVWTWGESWTQQ